MKRYQPPNQRHILPWEQNNITHQCNQRTKEHGEDNRGKRNDVLISLLPFYRLHLLGAIKSNRKLGWLNIFICLAVSEAPPSAGNMPSIVPEDGKGLPLRTYSSLSKNLSTIKAALRISVQYLTAVPVFSGQPSEILGPLTQL